MAFLSGRDPNSRRMKALRTRSATKSGFSRRFSCAAPPFSIRLLCVGLPCCTAKRSVPCSCSQVSQLSVHSPAVPFARRPGSEPDTVALQRNGFAPLGHAAGHCWCCCPTASSTDPLPAGWTAQADSIAAKAIGRIEGGSLPPMIKMRRFRHGVARRRKPGRIATATLTPAACVRSRRVPARRGAALAPWRAAAGRLGWHPGRKAPSPLPSSQGPALLQPRTSAVLQSCRCAGTHSSSASVAPSSPILCAAHGSPLRPHDGSPRCTV